MRNRLIVCSFVFVVSALCVRPVAAQDTAGDVFLGYTFLGSDELAVNADNLPWGFAAGGAWRLNEWFSLALDISGNYKNGIDPCGVDRPLGDPECRLLEGVETAAPTTEFQGL